MQGNCFPALNLLCRAGCLYVQQHAQLLYGYRVVNLHNMPADAGGKQGENSQLEVPAAGRPCHRMQASTIYAIKLFSKASTGYSGLPSLLLCGIPLAFAPKIENSWVLALHDTLGLAHFPRSARVNHALPSGVAGSVCYMQSLH